MTCCAKSVASRAHPASAFKRSKNTAPLAVLTSCSKSGVTIARDRRNCLAMRFCRTSEIHNHRGHRRAQGSTGYYFASSVLVSLMIFSLCLSVSLCVSLWPLWLSLLFPHHQLRDRGQLHVRGAFIDFPDSPIAPIFLDWIIFCETVSAVDFDCERRHALGHLRREQFGHSGFFHETDAGVFHAGSVINHQARRFDFGCHLRDLELDPLKFRNRLPELRALLRIFRSAFPRAARYAQHLRANPNAAFVQRFDRDFVSLADFAEHVLFRHTAIFQNQLAS